LLDEPSPDETPDEPLPVDEPLPDEPDVPLLAVALALGLAVAALEPELEPAPLEPAELVPAELLDEAEPLVAVPLRWACAACSANRPRLAAPAVTTTATAIRARPRTLFMPRRWAPAL
jgi:hypothetical protein